MAPLILGTDKTKVVVSDRFSSYDWIEQHQYCWSHLRRDFQAMIDRRDVRSAIGTELLGSSDRLFHWWHRYRDGEMAWSTFLGYARPIRWGVRQTLGRGVSCASEKTAAMCRMLLEGEEHMWTFLGVDRALALIPLVVHADGRRDRGIGLLALDPGLVLHVGDRRPLGIMGGRASL